MNIVPIDQFFSDMSEEERESYSGPKVIGKIDLPEVKVPCTHDWGNIHDDYHGVYRCKKCGKYSA
jgi:Cu/Ag efflux protein CusF